MKLMYIAGRYRSDYPDAVKLNIAAAQHAGMLVAEKGWMPVVPHSNNTGFNSTQIPEFWLEGTLELMRRCDAVFFIQGWGRSPGARAELRKAKMLGMPIYYETGEMPNETT